MIKSFFITILLAFSVSAQTSNVQTVKAWVRNPVMGDVETGELRDTSGLIAEGQRAAAIEAALQQSTNLIASAHTGLTNALQSLYTVTNRISEFTGRIYIAADMDEDIAYSNVYLSVGKEWIEDTTNVHYWVYSNYELATCPATIWDFELSPTEIVYVDGQIQNSGNAVTNINGISYYHIKVPRPTGAASVTIRTNKHMKIGHTSKPLDLAAAGITLNGTNLYTGTISETNGARVVTRTYSHGVLVTRTDTGGQ
jgi:hypothetical protein